MMPRKARKTRPVLEGLEWRLAPSGGPGPSGHDPVDVDPGPPGGHDPVDNDPADDNDNGPGAVDNDPNDDDAQDAAEGGAGGGHWEPKPIGHGSTRPLVPSGPIIPPSGGK